MRFRDLTAVGAMSSAGSSYERSFRRALTARVTQFGQPRVTCSELWRCLPVMSAGAAVRQDLLVRDGTKAERVYVCLSVGWS